jgi:hypothetical protein
MNIIACIDDNKGQLFNGRRQSKDIQVISKILNITEGKNLLINSFSEKLFEEKAIVNVDFLECAGEGDFCFIENVSASEYIEKINKVYLFKWNRKYPSDFTFDLELENNFHLVSVEEFQGNSHELVTLEVWVK